MENNKVIILIPAYNEIKTVKIICKKFKQLKYNFLVLDDCSDDKSDYWLKENKIKFIKNKFNLGYEENLLNGIKYVLKKNYYTHIITYDADMEHELSDLKRAKKLIETKNFDLAVFNRKSYNRWSEYILNYFFNLKFSIKDPLSGLKIYKIDELKKITKKIKREFFLVDIVVLFKLKKLKILNILINSNARRNSRVGNNLKINLKILGCLKLLF